MKNKLKILHLEDLPSDAELVERELNKGNISFEKKVVANEEDFKNVLKSFNPDLILSDHSLPAFNSIEALKIIKSRSLNIPFILITSTISEDFAVSVLKQGADDYILKDNMSRLPSAIEHAMDIYNNRAAKCRAEQELKAAHERLLFHLENSPLGYIEWEYGKYLKTWSRSAQDIFGWTKDEFAEKGKDELGHIYKEDKAMVTKIINQLLAGSQVNNKTQCRCYTKDNRLIWTEWFNSVLKDKDGGILTIMSLVQDITERKNAELTLITKEIRFREFFETAPDAILVIDPETMKFVDFNESALKLFKFSAAELSKKTFLDVDPYCPTDNINSEEIALIKIKRAMRGERPVFDWLVCDSSGKEFFCEIRLSLLTHNDKPMVRASLMDITEKLALENRLTEEKINKQVEITSAILNAQERERSFLGEELHDNINQLLAASKMYLEHAMKTDESKKDHLITSKNYIINAMEEIRNLSKSLLPPTLGDSLLSDSIADLLDSVKIVNPLEFETHWTNVREQNLSEKLRLAIYRVIQEQLNNVIKYAQARKVTILLHEQNEILELSIKDDGKGFDTSLKRTGVGLQNIASRTNFFNGNVNIYSSPGKGSELVATFKIVSSDTED